MAEKCDHVRDPARPFSPKIPAGEAGARVGNYSDAHERVQGSAPSVGNSGWGKASGGEASRLSSGIPGRPVKPGADVDGLRVAAWIYDPNIKKPRA
jgi:hypothetical protein